MKIDKMTMNPQPLPPQAPAFYPCFGGEHPNIRSWTFTSHELRSKSEFWRIEIHFLRKILAQKSFQSIQQKVIRTDPTTVFFLKIKRVTWHNLFWQDSMIVHEILSFQKLRVFNPLRGKEPNKNIYKAKKREKKKLPITTLGGIPQKKVSQWYKWIHL